MSLLKQLLISVSLAILIILGGTLWLSVDSARSYLNTQLQAQTDSAATSLALTLSQPSNQDPVTQELIIMAQFDSGQFSRIALHDPEGVSLLNRQTEGDSKGDAPQWFTRLLPVLVAESAAQVSDGWRQVGQVYLQADATYARDTLWHSFTRLVVWVLGAGVIWAVFVLFLMRWLRRMLHDDVTLQLKALTHHDPSSVQSTHKPHRKSTFSELSEVTQAIASARESILLTTEEQHAKIESLEIELNQDAVTGLVNRKYFVNELRRQLENAQTKGGWLFLFRQRDLAEINRIMARSNVDEWLRSLSEQLQVVLQRYGSEQSQFTLARLNGSDFVILGTDVEAAVMQQLVKEVQTILRQQRIQFSNGAFCRWAMAQTDFKSGQFLAHVLGRLDQALMRAESAGHNLVEQLTSDQVADSVDQPKGGETQWRAIIQEGLIHNRFSLHLQTTAFKQQLWHEATLQLQPTPTQNDLLLGYQFMPVATRLGLSGVCDLRAFELALDWLAKHPSERLIMRVSLSSITQDSFSEQVAKQFAIAGLENTRRLYIELDAYSLVSEPVAVSSFGVMVDEYHVKLGVRRALSLPRVLLDLTMYKAAYLRTQVSELLEITQKTGGNIMLRSALDIAKQAGVTFVLLGNNAELSATTRQMLQEYGIGTE